MGQSDVELYVHAVRDIVFGTSLLGLYFILRFPLWWVFAAHSATFAGIFFLYSSNKTDVVLPTLAGAVALAVAAVDAFAFLNTICLWNRCCVDGYVFAPWSFGVQVCSLKSAYNVPSVVFLAAATVAIGFFAGVQRAWSIWGGRPQTRFDVSLFVLYCGIKIWLMQWRFIVRSFLASAVLVGSMGLDLGALVFVRRSTSLAVLLFCCALALDVLVVLVRGHVVQGLSGPALGHPSTNGRHLLQMDTFSAVMSETIASQVTLQTSQQRKVAAAFEPVRFEWNTGFKTFNASLWAAESSLVSNWLNPLFESPLNATITDLASYSTTLSLAQAEALWTDALLQFGTFTQQLTTASYLYESAIIQGIHQFNITAEHASADAATSGSAALGGGSAGASFAASIESAQLSVNQALTNAQANLQTTAGTSNLLAVNTQQQQTLLVLWGPPAANTRYDLTFASALSSMKTFQTNYHATLATSVSQLSTATASAISSVDSAGALLGNVFLSTAKSYTPVEYTSYWTRFKNAFWYPILRLVFGRDMHVKPAVTSSWALHGKVIAVPNIVNTAALAAYGVCGGVIVAQIVFAVVQKIPKKEPKEDLKHSVFFGAEDDGGGAVVRFEDANLRKRPKSESLMPA